MKPTVGSLFAGIGGFDLGLERAGFETKWQVEIDDFCNKVLEKHWPDVKRYRDVREVGKHNLEPVDLICGGFPCQPFSVAGKRQGDKDDRFLWPEMLRIIDELRPTWVIGENVPGIINLALDDCLSSLEDIGYATWTAIIPAAGVGATHRRDRVWIVGYAERLRLEHSSRISPGNPEGQVSTQGTGEDVADAEGNGRQPRRAESAGQQGQSGAVYGGPAVPDAKGNNQRPGLRKDEPNEQRRGRPGDFNSEGNAGKPCPELGCRLDGLPRGMAGWLDGTWEAGIPRVTKGEKDRAKKLKALGNAVVPQIPEALGRLITEESNYVTRLCNQQIF